MVSSGEGLVTTSAIEAFLSAVSDDSAIVSALLHVQGILSKVVQITLGIALSCWARREFSV